MTRDCRSHAHCCRTSEDRPSCSLGTAAVAVVKLDFTAAELGVAAIVRSAVVSKH